MRPPGPLPETLARSTPSAAAARAATGETFAPVGRRLPPPGAVACAAAAARRQAARAAAGGALASAAAFSDDPRDHLADGDGLALLDEDLA